ncbi:hypothetical protein GQ53DRAFT_834683 [Thozetella sp. PMI_491]|nr:hypothetical protein GQ53DRAFT_834683 [Thozetella sp. PMI_491]
MATLAFRKLPLEIRFLIFADLDLNSLRSLRLASRATMDAFEWAFPWYFEVQHADLSRPDLDRMLGIAAIPALRMAVRRINLVCPHFHKGDCTRDPTAPRGFPTETPEEADYGPAGIARRQAWIAERIVEQEAFRQEQMCSMLTEILMKLPNVQAIKLEAAVVLQENWRQGPETTHYLDHEGLWTRSLQGYGVLLTSIARAEPQNLKELVIFQETLMCSIPMHHVSDFLERTVTANSFAAVASRLQHFSISLSTTPGHLRPKRRKKSGPGDEINYVIRLLRLMPNLTSLHIHLFRAVSEGLGLPGRLLPMLAQSLHFPHLVDLSVHGVPASQATLQSIVRKHGATLQSIWLEHLFVTDGTCDEVVSMLGREAKSLKHLRLWSLHEARRGFRDRVDLVPNDLQLGPDTNGNRARAWLEQRIKYLRYPNGYDEVEVRRRLVRGANDQDSYENSVRNNAIRVFFGPL